MTVRRPIVLVNGRIEELSLSDTLPSAPGSAAIYSCEIDFGTTSAKEKTFTVTDPAIVNTDKILITHSAAAATGRSQDENEMDVLICRAVSGVGQFTVYVNSLYGPVCGKYKLNYMVG